MGMYGPISDMLAHIRNAQHVSKATIAMPFSRLKCAIVKVLRDGGYTRGFTVSANAEPVLEIQLKYYIGRPVIKQVRHVSHPGLYIYKTLSEIPSVMSGLGVATTSTSKGMMTDHKAHSEDVGGELLCITA